MTGNIVRLAWVSLIGQDDLSANPIGLKQSWLPNLPIGGSRRSAVCHEPILLSGLGT